MASSSGVRRPIIEWTGRCSASGSTTLSATARALPSTIPSTDDGREKQEAAHEGRPQEPENASGQWFVIISNQWSVSQWLVHSRLGYCAGMVIRGSCSLLPVSAIVNKNMTAVSARFVRQSRSSTQNHCSR